MTISLSALADIANQNPNKQPNIVLKIDGDPTCYGAVVIKKKLKYGDPVMYGDFGLVYGGSTEVEDQEDLISFQKGTTTNITQNVNIDTGTGNSIQSMQLALVDIGGVATQLISPGFKIDDILGARCTIYFGYESTNFPDDFIVLFKGNVDEVKSVAGLVTLNVIHPDNFKRANLFTKAESELANVFTTLSAGINNSTISIPCVDASLFPNPTGLPATIKIDSEEVTYTGKSGNTLTGAVRGANGTSAASHLINAVVDLLGITAEQTIITVDDASSFFTPVTGPDGTIDQTIKYYGVIDGTEAFQYTGISGNQFTGVVRAQLGTVPAVHSDGSSVESLVRLNGEALEDIALKLMMSGWDGPFITGLTIRAFEQLGATTIENAIFFEGVNVVDEYNLRVGDFVSVTGATNPANDITLIEVLEIGTIDDGSGTSYIVVNATLTTETSTGAVIDFRSQYDTWGAGRGMQMLSEDVDIDEHLRISGTFMGGFSYDFYIKDSLDDSKEFMDREVYNPAGCFSLVRSARASLGVQYPPLPTDVVKILNEEKVTNASNINLKRSSSRNFYNGVVYKFEDQVDEEKLLKVEAVLSGDSKSRFGQKIPDKFLVIESSGMREALNARAFANSIAARRLSSYQFGAEYINGLKLDLESGLTVEAGDVVLLDMSQLQVSDIDTGSRAGDPRLWRINKKSFNVKTGEVAVDIVDTNFDKSVRYSLISPSSYIKFVNSQTQFVIQESFGGDTFGPNEFRKWEDFVGANVVIRDANYTTVSNPVQLLSLTANTITLAEDPGITLAEGLVMEFAPYDELGVDDVNATVKLVYASITDDENDFPDGGAPYRII